MKNCNVLHTAALFVLPAVSTQAACSLAHPFVQPSPPWTCLCWKWHFTPSITTTIITATFIFIIVSDQSANLSDSSLFILQPLVCAHFLTKNILEAY